MHAYTHFKWLFGHIMQWMLNTRYACFYLCAICHVHSHDCDMRCPIWMQYYISADVAIYSTGILPFIHCSILECIHIEMIWTTLYRQYQPCPCCILRAGACKHAVLCELVVMDIWRQFMFMLTSTCLHPLFMCNTLSDKNTSVVNITFPCMHTHILNGCLVT